MAKTYETINTYAKDDIFYLEINRPDKLNALNKMVLDEMSDAIKSIDVSKYKGVILTSVGDKAFMAGADIAAMSQMTPQETKVFAETGQAVTLAMEDSGPAHDCLCSWLCTWRWV